MSKHGPGMRCPHCASFATARTSTQLTRTFREVTYSCRNLDCGHVYVAGLEALRTLSPSACPHPEVRLAFSPHIRRQQLVAQLSLDLEPHHAAVY